MPARIRVDREACIACGVCWSIAPEVFEQDPSVGKTRIKEPYAKSNTESESVGEVPDELVEKVRDAASACPTRSIVVEERH